MIFISVLTYFCISLFRFCFAFLSLTLCVYFFARVSLSWFISVALWFNVLYCCLHVLVVCCICLCLCLFVFIIFFIIAGLAFFVFYVFSYVIVVFCFLCLYSVLVYFCVSLLFMYIHRSAFSCFCRCFSHLCLYVLCLSVFMYLRVTVFLVL